MSNLSKTITLRPRLSEKAYAHSLEKNVFVFIVPGSATKQSITQAVESQFDVTVVNVRTLVQNGKAVISRTKRTRGITVHRKDVKKAYVTLKQGDHIAIFDAPEDKSSEKKADKKSKSSEKKETK